MKNKLAKNSIYNILYQGFQVLFPLITSAYISRVLQPQGIGKISYASTVVNYFIVLASLGLPNYGVKAIAQNNSDILCRSKTFFELFIINSCSTICSIIIYFVLINNMTYFNDKRLLLNIMGLQLILNFFNVDWFYQGIEAYRAITIRSVLVKIISFALMVIFVKSYNDINIYAIILCVGVAGNYIYNVVLLNKYLVHNRVKIQVRKHIKPIITLYAATIASQIYQMIDSVMIDYFYPAAYLGYYSNCIKIVRMVHTFTIALVIPFFPRISDYIVRGENQRCNELMTIGTKILVIITMPCFVGMELMAKDIVLTLFGDQYVFSIICLRALAPLIVILSFAYFNGQIILIAQGKEKIILITTSISAVVNAVLNYVLIPRYAHIGAAIASVITELIVTAIVICQGRKYYKVSVNKEFANSFLVSISCMFLVICVVKCFGFPSYLNVIITIPLVVIIYILMLCLTKNDLIYGFVQRIRLRYKKTSK